ncbi:hypothetical protein, partial [Burkholderia ubonensis]|uniref:hypothetical protein n=1 Tax=Burkholderia ubonensis TaxID=101571 RepID=UPI001E642C62
PALIRCATSTRAGSALRVRAIDSVRSGDEIELSQRNFYLNSIVPKSTYALQRISAYLVHLPICTRCHIGATVQAIAEDDPIRWFRTFSWLSGFQLGFVRQ